LNQKSVGKTQECFRIKRLFVIFSLKNTLQVSLQNKIRRIPERRVYAFTLYAEFEITFAFIKGATQ